MKVIKFAPGLIPVLKHQEHDQKTHGNWATGGEITNWSPGDPIASSPRNAGGMTETIWENWEHGPDGNQYVELYRQYAGEALGIAVPRSPMDVGGESNYLTQRGFGGSSTDTARKQSEAIVKAIANGKPEQPALYRGMTATDDAGLDLIKSITQLKAGDTLDMPLVSTTRSLGVAAWYAADRSPNGLNDVIMKIQPGAKGVSLSKETSRYPQDHEVITSGKFEVVSVNTVQAPYWKRETLQPRQHNWVEGGTDYEVVGTSQNLGDPKTVYETVTSGNWKSLETPNFKLTDDRHNNRPELPILSAWVKQPPREFTVVEVKFVEPHVIKKAQDYGLTFDVLFNNVPFIREEDVAKHQEHDQSSHGNWADGSQGSSTELSDDEIRDIISGSDTVNEMYQKVAERLGKSMKPKLEDLSEEEINFYRGVTDVDRDAQRLLDGKVPFTPFQTWGQGIYISSEPDYAATYGDLIRLRLDKSAKLVEGEIAWSKAFSLFDKESSLDMPKILERITSGKMDNFSDSDIANIYWAAKGYDGYSAYATGRAEVVLFNADKLTVNKADIGEAVRKHGSHDQKTHGNWADGSSESGLDAMPYEWKPKLNKSGMTDEEYAKNAEILKKIAEAPVSTYLYGMELDLIVKEGRFKSLSEIPTGTENLVMASEEYRQGRADLENGLWGVPTTGVQPIYGFMDTDHGGHKPATIVYGDVKVTLKDNVSGRTTFSVGDSLNSTLVPVKVSDARAGTLSKQEMAGSFTSQKTETYSVQSELRSPDRIGYFEAQVHGGISLKDIKSVTISQYARVSPSTIETLTALGVEVIRVNDNR